MIFYYYDNINIPYRVLVCNSEQHFSSTYSEARNLFLQRIKDLQAIHFKVRTYQFPVAEYFTDVVVIGENKLKYLFHISGVHGPEGFAGSAIQVITNV